MVQVTHLHHDLVPWSLMTGQPGHMSGTRGPGNLGRVQAGLTCPGRVAAPLGGGRIWEAKAKLSYKCGPGTIDSPLSRFCLRKVRSQASLDGLHLS
jgi:hypothetical protein